MSKINSLKNIRINLEELCSITDVLKTDLPQVYKFILNGNFIPVDLEKRTADSLYKLSQVQENIEHEFTSLKIGNLPDKTSKLTPILEEYQEKWEKQDKYLGIIKFFLSLHSGDEVIEKLLETRKRQLKQLDLESLNDAELNEMLYPYILLKNILTESDIQKKFSMMYQLPQYFEEAIFAGIGYGKITFMPEEGNNTESETREETLKAPEVSNNQCTTEEPSSILQISEKTDASEAPAETESSEVKPENKGDYSEVIDSEGITESESNFENDFEKWNELEIINPESVCYKEQSGLLTVETSPKAKDKFGVSKFKNDIAKQACRDKLTCLVEILNGTAYSKESIAISFRREKGYYDHATDKLYQMGYLAKYSVNGMGEFYSLSSRGKKAFTTKDSFAFIKNHNPNVSNNPMFGKSEAEETANVAITRIMLTSCYAKAARIDSSYTFYKKNIFVSDNSFFLSLPFILEDYDIFFLGIVTEKVEEFQDFRNMVENIPGDCIPDYLIVVEPDKALARNVAKWLLAFTDSLSIVGYCAYNEEEIYDASTGEILEIPAYEDDSIIEENGKEAMLDEVFEDDSPENEDVNSPITSEDTDHETEPESTKTEKAVSDEQPKEERQEEFLNHTVENPVTDEAIHQEENSVMNAPSRLTVPKPLLLTEADKQNYDANYQKMLSARKFYAASAYLKSLAEEFPYYKSIYQQIAYALNDPMENCSYNSDTIINVFYKGETPVSDYFVISAAIRNYFYDQFSYDYTLPQLQSMIAKSSILNECKAAEKIVYDLQKFKVTYRKGMDRYADYRKKEQGLLEERMEQTKREAKGYYDNYSSGYQKENASHKRFIETYRLLLGPKSDLSEYLKVVFEDNRDMLEMLEDFLAENYVKDKASVCEENIDPAKIENALDTYWDKATENIRLVKRSSDLMSSLRMNLFKKVQKVVIVLCNYIFLCRTNVSTQDDPAFVEYKKSRKSLIKTINDAVSSLASSDTDETLTLAGKKVLTETLMEIHARISGEYKEGSYKYYYLDFLKSNKVLLDEDYLPILDEVLELPSFSVRKRILQHCDENTDKSWEERIDDIYKKEDNYGSAELIFQYVESQGIPFKNLEEQRAVKEDAMKYPESDMNNKRREFIEDLELAQSYGQIDNSRVNTKEVILQIMENWYEWAKKTANYGFFSQILDSFLERIHEDAKTREADLNNELQVYLSKNKSYEEDENVSGIVEQIKDRIQQQNYAAAEDLLNRLIRNDLDEGGFTQQSPDYLQEFLNEYDIDYQKTANSGFTLKSLLSSNRSNKDTKGGNKLLENWPKGIGVGENRIRILLSALGFNIDTVKTEPRIQDKIESYVVTLKRPKNGRRSNYKHPISAFGSEAETKGFRVVCLFGKTDASRLIDTFKEIGNAKNTLVLLDYSLPLADRRLLARKTKTDLSGKIFAVLDRVALLYLAKHYSETAINRMLMYIIMPFASYQPYIDQSAAVMPQEIFIGRRDELEKIESPTGVNLVYGGRQLGKTALLRMAQKDVDMNENGDRAIIVDVHDKDYHTAAQIVSAALYDEGILKKENITDDWDMIARDIKNRLRDTKDPIPYFLLMIDEADRFIESSEVVNYQPFDALKDIQAIGAGRFKFVVAGLRNIVRFKKSTVLKNNNSLVHLDSLTVKPFKAMEARELLEVPLSYLGFRFPDDNETEVLISTIFGTTNYFPGLLQMYCTKMIETMRRDYAGYSESETPPYYVKKEHIKKVLAEQSLQNDIYNKFSITLKIGNDDYYYIIALLVAYHYHDNKSSNGCNAQELMELANAYGIKKLTSLDKEKLNALMEEMQELNILQYTGDGRYRFTRHSFCQMMGTPEHIDNELEKYMED